MSILKKLKKQRLARKFRTKNRVNRVNRLSHKVTVFRSNKHIYATLVEVKTGASICSYSSLNVQSTDVVGNNKKMSELVGQEFGKLCLQRGIEKIAFDRGSYLYHGKIAALAEGMRQSGLQI